MARLKKHLLKFKLQMFHKNCDGWRYAKVGVMYANMWVTQMSEQFYNAPAQFDTRESFFRKLTILNQRKF